MMRLAAVAAVVLLPMRFLKRGLIDWQQTEAFPKRYRTLFLGMYFTSIIFFAYFAVIWLT